MLCRIVSEFVSEPSAYNFFAQNLNELLDFYQKYYCAAVRPRKFCVAVSGGSDSMALLFLLYNWAQKNEVEVFCVTIDHQLREESLAEAMFVRAFCESKHIKHEILIWNSENDKINHGKLENSAREARYQLILEFCARESIGIVLTGHTWNDQLETFAIRKSRGSSGIGLAGISRIRSLTNDVKLLRPLLYFTRDYLKNFLCSKGIIWKNDPMNDDERFQRVLWRKKIASYDIERTSELSKEIMLLGKTRHDVETKAVACLRAFCEFSQRGSAIQLRQFLAEEKAVQMEILRRIIWNVGEKKYAPSLNTELLSQILDGKINTLGKCLLKVGKEEIFVFLENRNSGKILPYRLQSHRMGRGNDGGSSSEGVVFVNNMNLFDIFQ
ncbi:MAG: tRNA lysidine(34) synthetase TilS [Holosporaceae bacterium]|jgi:tRNA(Ile)-lysidine synthase|nr:tRNA lysidine(34) synthetase TilS [Holosporaceae bacterium]